MTTATPSSACKCLCCGLGVVLNPCVHQLAVNLLACGSAVCLSSRLSSSSLLLIGFGCLFRRGGRQIRGGGGRRCGCTQDRVLSAADRLTANGHSDWDGNTLTHYSLNIYFEVSRNLPGKLLQDNTCNKWFGRSCQEFHRPSLRFVCHLLYLHLDKQPQHATHAPTRQQHRLLPHSAPSGCTA